MIPCLFVSLSVMSSPLFVGASVEPAPLAANAPSKSFSPSDVAGLTFWLEANSVVGNPVTQINDQSGNGNHATLPAGAAALALNPAQAWCGNRPTVSCAQAGAHQASIPSVTLGPMTIFVVLKAQAPQSGTQQNIFDHFPDAARNAFALQLNGFSTVHVVRPPGGDTSKSIAQLIPDNAGHYWRFRFAGTFASMRSWLNGVEQVLAPNNVGDAGVSAVAGQFWIMGQDPVGVNVMTGELAMILGYNAALSDADCAAIETYIATRFSL